MTNKWDPVRAEYADTKKAQRERRRLQHCIYCGKLTRATSRICCDHEDLPAFEGNDLMQRTNRETDYF